MADFDGECTPHPDGRECVDGDKGFSFRCDCDTGNIDNESPCRCRRPTPCDCRAWNKVACERKMCFWKSNECTETWSAYCVDTDGNVTEDSYCDEATKPECDGGTICIDPDGEVDRTPPPGQCVPIPGTSPQGQETIIGGAIRYVYCPCKLKPMSYSAYKSCLSVYGSVCKEEKTAAAVDNGSGIPVTNTNVCNLIADYFTCIERNCYWKKR